MTFTDKAGKDRASANACWAFTSTTMAFIILDLPIDINQEQSQWQYACRGIFQTRGLQYEFPTGFPALGDDFNSNCVKTGFAKLPIGNGEIKPMGAIGKEGFDNGHRRNWKKNACLNKGFMLKKTKGFLTRAARIRF